MLFWLLYSATTLESKGAKIIFNESKIVSFGANLTQKFQICPIQCHFVGVSAQCITIYTRAAWRRSRCIAVSLYLCPDCHRKSGLSTHWFVWQLICLHLIYQPGIAELVRNLVRLAQNVWLFKISFSTFWLTVLILKSPRIVPCRSNLILSRTNLNIHGVHETARYLSRCKSLCANWDLTTELVIAFI